MQKSDLEAVAEFIREHRSSESGYEKLYAKLKEEAGKNDQSPTYHTALQDAMKKADEYVKAKEGGGTAWPEFEKFVSEFEKGVIEAMKEIG